MCRRFPYKPVDFKLLKSKSKKIYKETKNTQINKYHNNNGQMITEKLSRNWRRKKESRRNQSRNKEKRKE